MADVASPEVHKALAIELKAMQNRHLFAFERSGRQIVPKRPLLGIGRHVEGESFGVRLPSGRERTAELIRTAVNAAFKRTRLPPPRTHIRCGIGGKVELVVVPRPRPKIDVGVLFTAIINAP